MSKDLRKIIDNLYPDEQEQLYAMLAEIVPKARILMVGYDENRKISAISHMRSLFPSFGLAETKAFVEQCEKTRPVLRNGIMLGEANAIAKAAAEFGIETVIERL